MFQRGLVSGLLLGAVFAIGCSADDSSDPDTSNGGSGASALALPSCVLEIVQDKCQRCHGDPLQHGAPVAFFSVNDFQAQYFGSEFKWWEVAADRVEGGSMPLVALNDTPNAIMPPVEPLTPDEKATLLDWLKAGALPDSGADCL